MRAPLLPENRWGDHRQNQISRNSSNLVVKFVAAAPNHLNLLLDTQYIERSSMADIETE